MQIDSAYTDASGHFLVNFHTRENRLYSLVISKEGYFDDRGVEGPLAAINNINYALFPQGYIKTHIINEIDTARWFEIYFNSYFSSQLIFRDGFVNTSVFARAFADTTICTTIVGGVTNNLQILVTPSDNTADNVVVKDTSFITVSHDTLFLDIVLL